MLLIPIVPFAIPAAAKDKPISEAIFPLLFYSGMRESEALALTLNDFDFENNTVNINKTYAKHNGQDLIQTPKTPKSKRVITLSVQIMELIKKYAGSIYGYEPTDRLFTCTKYYLAHEMVRGCKKTGVKRIRIHDLRHTFATIFLSFLLRFLQLFYSNINIFLYYDIIYAKYYFKNSYLASISYFVFSIT